ncbi:hypothetical protein M9H77_06556 [Catharanthus roseus]|uniref:Uncharacterized protein n=1 Tax=Catharanthus roseus TaxID=4058 RepID=A0ACC0BSH4_CATRO|nr:hypothetical protein M9H77_06556 [Catharanthus roseus]
MLHKDDKNVLTKNRIKCFQDSIIESPSSSFRIKLPIIDFSSQDLKFGTPIWDSVKIEVRKALEEFGCFKALFDKIPLPLRKSLFEGMADLFYLPLQTKIKNSSKKPFHGLHNVGQYPIAPLYESMGIEEPISPEKVESFTKLMWPQGNSTFSKTIQSYSEQLAELDKIVRRMILESFGLEKYMNEHMDSTDYLLRIMKYKGPQTNKTNVGLQATLTRTW